MGYGVMILFITLDRASCFYGFVQAARVFPFPSETGICLQPEMTGFYIPLHGAGTGMCVPGNLFFYPFPFFTVRPKNRPVTELAPSCINLRFICVKFSPVDTMSSTRNTSRP